jgi:hypothetical protein
MEKLIAKNATERVRVAVSEFHGAHYVDTRIHYQADDGEWRPTKKGLTLKPDLAREVAQAMLAVAGDDER